MVALVWWKDVAPSHHGLALTQKGLIALDSKSKEFYSKSNTWRRRRSMIGASVENTRPVVHR